MSKPDFCRSCDIIELIDSDDSEGKLLWQLFKRNGVRGIYRYGGGYSSIDELFEAFTVAIVERNSAAMSSQEPLHEPQLHISCHGCEQGIFWVDDSLITWERLRALLLRFAEGIGYLIGPQQNGAFQQALGLISLSLSCCYGSSAAKVFFSREPYPVIAFLSPKNKIYIEDCADFFYRFYSFTLNSPWNVPAIVSELLAQRMPCGEDGPSPIECHTPFYAPNPDWRPPNSR